MPLSRKKEVSYVPVLRTQIQVGLGVVVGKIREAGPVDEMPQISNIQSDKLLVRRLIFIMMPLSQQKS